MVKYSFINSALSLKENLRAQQSRAKANAQKKEQQQRQLRESLQAQGINSIKHMHQQKQLEETKRKQEYVLSSPLLHACPPLPLHAAMCGCFLSLCAEEYMTPFQYNAVLLIYTSQGIWGEPEVKEVGDCGKNSSGR